MGGFALLTSFKKKQWGVVQFERWSMEFFDYTVPDVEDVISGMSRRAPPTPDDSLPVASNSALQDSSDSVDSAEFVNPSSSHEHSHVIDNADYDMILLEAQFSNSQAALPRLCWEEGIFNDIFGNTPSNIPNLLNILLQQPDLEPVIPRADVSLPSAGSGKG